MYDVFNERNANKILDSTICWGMSWGHPIDVFIPFGYLLDVFRIFFGSLAVWNYCFNKMLNKLIAVVRLDNIILTKRYNLLLYRFGFFVLINIQIACVCVCMCVRPYYIIYKLLYL